MTKWTTLINTNIFISALRKWKHCKMEGRTPSMPLRTIRSLRLTKNIPTSFLSRKKLYNNSSDCKRLLMSKGTPQYQRFASKWDEIKTNYIHVWYSKSMVFVSRVVVFYEAIYCVEFCWAVLPSNYCVFDGPLQQILQHFRLCQQRIFKTIRNWFFGWKLPHQNTDGHRTFHSQVYWFLNEKE